MTQIILDTPSHKIEIADGNVNTNVSKPTSPTDITLAFPPLPIAELNDFAYDTNNDQTARGQAIQILTSLKGNRDMDILSAEFDNTVSFIKTITSFNDAQEAEFRAKLGI